MEIKFKKIKIIIDKDGEEEEICINVEKGHAVQIENNYGVKQDGLYPNMIHTGKEFHKILIFPEQLIGHVDTMRDNEIIAMINR